MSATEHQGDIIFLYSVDPGPASQSYGIQVAKLAGVPAQRPSKSPRKNWLDLSKATPTRYSLIYFAWPQPVSGKNARRRIGAGATRAT